MVLHPVIAHFSVALLFVSIFFDLLALLKSQSFLQTPAFYLLVLGVVAGVSAGITGNDAFQGLAISTQQLPQVQSHTDFGTGTIWLSILLLLFRFYLAVRRRFFGGFRLAYFALGLVVAGLLSVTGYFGGKLVFEHGIGVKTVSPHYLTP